MTIEDAIKHCEEVAAGATEQGKCPECAADHKQLAEWLIELIALRAQQTPAKMDRRRWEGCGWCIEPCTDAKGYPHWNFEFCPNCGRPLTEEAWAELKKRGVDIEKSDSDRL